MADEVQIAWGQRSDARMVGIAYAADKLAESLAKGEIAWASVQHIAGIWAEGHSGDQSRICWRIGDEARAIQRCWRDAERRIRKAVAPLFQAGAPKHAIEEAAGNANADTLPWDYIYPILRDEMLRACRS
jgi:hypothetical protein